MTTPTLLKKISVRTVCDMDVRKEIHKPDFFDENGEKHLVRVMASIAAAVPKKTDYGISYGFKGTIEAVNIDTGETFTSGMVYLPEVLEAQVLSQRQATEDDTPVMFAADIIVKKDDKSPVGFIYTARPLVSKSADPLALLKEEMQALGLDGPLALESKVKGDAEAVEEAEEPPKTGRKAAAKK